MTACSAGDRPGGLGGAVYLLVRSSVRDCSFADVRSSMLSIGGRGVLSNAMHPCWIVQVPWIEQRSSRCVVEGQQ